MIGETFMDVYQGYTMTGYGTVVKSWEVVKDLGNDRFECKLLGDDTVMELNKNYTENFSRHSIERYIKQNSPRTLKIAA